MARPKPTLLFGRHTKRAIRRRLPTTRMHCSACHSLIPDDSLFCTACGAKVEPRCIACGTVNPPGAKFCRRCGSALEGSTREVAAPVAYTPKHLADKILTSRSALEGERKLVTVLFADVKGSMELAEQLDPEEWHRILERFFEILTEGVHRFEGTVNQYTGDGIMALFGAPIAHEDHAQRAGYAALYARDALRVYADELRLSRGLNFSVRMGMNSGEVVVAKIGDDLRMDYTAQGREVGLAARMEQLAQPGTVLVTEHTAKLLSGYFALRDLGAATIKGVSEPLHVYELAGIGAWQTRFDESRARGLSRFVGREQEMAMLEDALTRALAGEGQIVGIVAEAGAGKSRLCYEFTERCRSRGVEVIVAFGLPHGRSVPFLPVLQILRALCGLTEHDGGEEARRKIAGALLMRDEAFRDDLPLLFDFLGVADPAHPSPRVEPEVLRRRLFDVIQRLIHTRTQGGPAMLLFEDLHWIDGASAAALERLIETVPATRTFLLVNFRPEYQAAWMRLPHYRQLSLGPLGNDAADALLHALLGPDPALAPLAERIRERAAGNPFFIEEMVQSLVEAGSLAGSRGAYRLGAATDVVLPATVQAALAARIDRLGESEKDALEAAAVIGKEFDESVLQRVADRSPVEVAAALQALVAGDFIYHAARHPEARYAFKHPLTQEVAYRSQLSERRARLHASVARAIEALHPNKLDEYAALIAQHWERAGDAAVAAEWHSRAATWVGARDRTEMLRHWRQVRTLLATIPATHETLPLRLLSRIQILHNGLFLGQARDEAALLFQEGVHLAVELGEPGLHIWLLGVYAMMQQQTGALDEGLMHAREGMRRADASGEIVLRVMVRVPLAWLLLQSGRLHEAVAVSEEGEALAAGNADIGADILGFSPLGSLLTLRASALTFLGQLVAARRQLERAFEIGRRRNDAEVLSWANAWAVNLDEITGRAGDALHHAQQAVELAEELGSAGMRSDAYIALARAHLLDERPQEALDTLNRARSVAGARTTVAYVEPLQLLILARTYLALHDYAHARDVIDRLIAVVDRHPTIAVVALLTHTQFLLATEGHAAVERIEAILRDAQHRMEVTDARGLEPFIHLECADLAQLLGDDARRRRELEIARAQFAAIGAADRAESTARNLAAGAAARRAEPMR